MGSIKKYFSILAAAYDFLHANVHQNDIRTNLPDAFPANNVFRISAQKAAPLPLSGNNQLTDTACFRIEFHISHKTNALTIPHVNNLLLAKFANTHTAPHKILLILCYAESPDWFPLPAFHDSIRPFTGKHPHKPPEQSSLNPPDSG